MDGLSGKFGAPHAVEGGAVKPGHDSHQSRPPASTPPFLDNGTNTTLAITGGTGRFAGAKGSMLLHATGHPAGSEFDFIFTLTH